MMNGREKSDFAVVAKKPANEAASAGEEPVERRAEAKGNAERDNTNRAQNRGACHMSWTAYGKQNLPVIHPRWEPYAGKPLVRFCAGGVQ